MKKLLIIIPVILSLLLCACDGGEKKETETHELATMTAQGEYVEIDEEDADVSEE